MHVVAATVEDLPMLENLEALAYQPYRRSSRASLLRSLRSQRQTVWIGRTTKPVASMVLWHFRHTLRIYAITVHPDAQGQGLGTKMLQFAKAHAPKGGRLVLEADAQDPGLLSWYEHRGFEQVAFKPDFYGKGNHAWRLELRA